MQCVCVRASTSTSGSTHSPAPLRGPFSRPYMCSIGEPRVASVCALVRPHPRRLNVYTICSLTRRCVRASFPVITPPLGVCRTRLSWDATSSGSESKSWQYRSWRSGCERRNEMCAFVGVLAVTKYWRKQVETRQNRRYITVPAEHMSASCWFRRAMVCIIM